MTIFVFFGQSFFQDVVFKLQEVFSERGISVFLENGLESFPEISYLTALRRIKGAKKIPETILKTRFKTKQTTYTLVFIKYLMAAFRTHLIWAFSVLLEDSLWIILKS
jgi:hypothetical protein